MDHKPKWFFEGFNLVTSLYYIIVEVIGIKFGCIWLWSMLCSNWGKRLFIVKGLTYKEELKIHFLIDSWINSSAGSTCLNLFVNQFGENNNVSRNLILINP